MTAYTVSLAEARPALLGALDAFEAAASHLDDLALLGESRCHGWSRLDCTVHVRVGLEELLAGCAAWTDDPADVDAASYWTTWQESSRSDPVPGIVWARRTASAYARPSGAKEHLARVVAGLRAAVGRLPETQVAFQGQVLTAGDLCATWAVELAVHHLDLGAVAGLPAPDRRSLFLARQTVEALRGQACPDECSDAQVVLTGFGREPSDLPGVPVLA